MRASSIYAFSEAFDRIVWIDLFLRVGCCVTYLRPSWRTGCFNDSVVQLICGLVRGSHKQAVLSQPAVRAFVQY